MPKNICTKQQENNRLAEDVCYIGRFLPDTIAVLFQFQEMVEGIIPGLPNPRTDLGGFVKRMLAPSRWFILKTVRLVEVLGKVDVIWLVEELEEESDSEAESGGADPPDRGRRGEGQEESEEGFD